MNWYAYAGGNPVVRIDPEGLDWLDDASNFSAGFADTVTFGPTGQARRWMGTDDFVNRNSGMYTGGSWTGVGWSVAMGGAAGARAAGARGAGMEFSHWIPKLFGGPRSIWNGNYVTTEATHSRTRGDTDSCQGHGRRCTPCQTLSLNSGPGYRSCSRVSRQVLATRALRRAWTILAEEDSA